MNRELTRLLLWAAAGAAWAAPVAAQEAPKGPSVAIEAIEARNLLAPIEEARSNAPGYRLSPGPDPAFGQGAKLSMEVGDATLFAITGRLNRPPSAYGPLDSGHARAFLQRRDSGKVYGGGISRNVGGLELSATYQYSKVTAGESKPDNQAWDDGPGKSHSLRGSLRVRFRP